MQTSTISHTIPPQNKQREQHEDTSLTVPKQCISAFKNLSTIELLFYVSRGIEFHWTGEKSMSRESKLPWNEVKDASTIQLQGSSADGPKKLRTVVVFPSPWNEPESVVEEVLVEIPVDSSDTELPDC